MLQSRTQATPQRNTGVAYRRWPWAICILLLLLINGCKDDEELILDKGAMTEAFADVIETAGVPEKVTKKEELVDSTSGTEELREDGSLWLCSVKTYSIEDGNSEFPLFNPNASVIYPGSLLQGKTLTNATPSVIPLPRAGGTISIDVIDGSEEPAFTVEEVSKSSIATAANNIIGKSSGVVPSNFNATFEEISSVEHLAFSLGLDVKSQYVEVAAGFDFTQDEQYSHFLVKLNQSFYTLSFDLPTSYSDLFAPGVTPEELAQYAGPGNPVTFISDVTYGRIYYMLIEYASSSTEIKASLKAAFNGSVASANLETAAEHLKATTGLKIKVVAFGGEAKSTITTIGETDIGKLAQLFGESTDIRTGVPISYVVRDAKNKETVSVKLATEYDVKECKPVATALGTPAMWLDAQLVYSPPNDPETEPGTCLDCVAQDGQYGYEPTDDSYASTLGGGDWNHGLAVEIWKDVSSTENSDPASYGKYHASSISGNAASRPVLAVGAFNNGKDALEFFTESDGEGAPDYHGRMTYSGGIFAGTDYTLFAVLSYPETLTLRYKLAFNNSWLSPIVVPNSYDYFMKGSSPDKYEQLVLGFNNAGQFVMGHGGGYQLTIDDPDFKPQDAFQVFAFTFSQEKGMAVYVNGVLIAEDKTLTHPLISNAGALIGAGPNTGSRVRIAEIKMYQQAASAAQVAMETDIINEKYGL